MITVYYNHKTYKNIVCIKFSKNQENKLQIALEDLNNKLTLIQIDYLFDLTIHN